VRLDEVLGQAFDLAIFDGAMTSDLKLPASAPLVNQLAICAFTLKDHTGSTTVTSGLTQLTVSDGENTYVVDPIKDGYPFGEDVVYVAIKPVTAALEVTATDGAVNYSKTLTSREYARNNGYNISLRMNASVDYLVGKIQSGSVVFEKRTAENPTLLTSIGSDVDVQDGGYYVVTGNVVIKGNVSFFGETHLILCDGAQLTVNGQIWSSHSLYIYGQDAGTGKLIIENGSYAMNINGSRLSIHGGDISASSSGNSCAVYISFSNFYMYGGIFTANSNISGQDATIDISSNNYKLSVYGGKLSASNPNGMAIKGKISSYNGIKFYWADTKDDWDNGNTYNNEEAPSNHHYAKAE